MYEFLYFLHEPTVLLFLKVFLVWYLGALVGGFVGVIYWRCLRGSVNKIQIKKLISILSQSSTCDYCNKKVGFIFCLPFIAFFFLKGKTSCCKRTLKLQHLYFESFFALSAVVIFFIVN
ncbi:prepilin peptidase [Shewanella sp. MMG014]|nr:prepilin peptidase [Shewanella sp. MMG014]